MLIQSPDAGVTVDTHIDHGKSDKNQCKIPARQVN